MLPNQHRKSKFASKSRYGLLVGYEGCDGYRIWDAGRRDIVRTCNVTFKSEKLFDSTVQIEIDKAEANRHAPSNDTVSLKPTPVSNVDDNAEPESELELEPEPEPELEPEPEPELEPEPEPEREQGRQRNRRPPRYLDDYVCNYNYALYATHVPNSYTEAINSEDAQLWKEVMMDEMKSHEENGTWKLCELPEGKHVLTNRWVYQVKIKGDGTVSRAKARLVRGCSQKPGIDYDELFSPVARYDTVRIIVTLLKCFNNRAYYILSILLRLTN